MCPEILSHTNEGKLRYISGISNIARSLKTDLKKEVSAPTVLESESSIARVSEEHSLPKSSSDGHSDPEISSHEYATAPSTGTYLHDGVKDTATPTKEESAAATNDDNTDTDCVPIVCNTTNVSASAAAG